MQERSRQGINLRTVIHSHAARQSLRHPQARAEADAKRTAEEERREAEQKVVLFFCLCKIANRTQIQKWC